jgi:RNA polymerase sigma factor (sigma-70 family)
MPKFNPDFWEVTLSAAAWERFSAQDHLHYREPGEAERSDAQSARARALLPQVRRIIREELTERQREVVELYFLKELNQRQVAERLGISQQSVSEHLYGKLRGGRVVGGAIRKLRKACAKHGIRWP